LPFPLPLERDVRQQTVNGRKGGCGRGALTSDAIHVQGGRPPTGECGRRGRLHCDICVVLSVGGDGDGGVSVGGLW